MIDFLETKDQIQAEMLEQVDKKYDRREGSLIQTAIGPVAWWLEGLLMTLSKWQDNGVPTTAVGTALENIAALRGITRKAASAAVRQGIFNTAVPEGSTFKTINGADSVIFTVGSLISQAEGRYIYRMTCQTAGEIGNAYTGAILPITAVDGLTSAEIGEIIVTGTEEETDEALRTRYFETFEAPAYGGNISEYRQSILAVAGVGAVQIYPAWQGGGTVLCSILTSDFLPANSALIKSVQDAICPAEDGETESSSNGYGVAPIGAAVTITTGTELSLNMTFTVEFIEGTENGSELYRQDIVNAIESYLLSIRKEWGSALKTHTISYPVSIYVSRIIYAILTVPQVVNVTNLLINGAAADLQLTETAALQQVPILGTVTINES